MAAPPSNRLFIADLPAHFDDAATQQVFGAYGTISSCKMLPPRKQGDKGAAIIEFTEFQEAEWIVTNLNGNMPEGIAEPVIVRYANPTGGPKGSSKGYGTGGGGAATAPASAADAWSGVEGGAEGTGDAAAGCSGTWSSGFTNNGTNNSGWNDGSTAGSGYGQADAGKGWNAGKNAASPYNGKGASKGTSKDGSACTGGAAFNARAFLDSVTKGGLLPSPAVRTDDMCVYIRGLPPDTTDLDIYKLFCGFGAIPPKGVKAMKNADGTCTSIGFVDFVDAAAAQAAIQAFNGFPLTDGSTLFLKTKSPSLKKGGKDAGGQTKGYGKGYQQAWGGPAEGGGDAGLVGMPAPPPPMRPGMEVAGEPGAPPPPTTMPPTPPPPVRPGSVLV